MITRKMILSFLIVVLTAPIVLASQNDPIAAALHPRGLGQRVHPVSGKSEPAELVILSKATLSGSNRQVVVWAERVNKEQIQQFQWIYAAVLEGAGEQWRVLDRRELTRALTLFTEVPGEGIDARALVTPLDVRGTHVVAIEVWSAMSGTALLSSATHVFFTVSADGKLEQALEIEGTYASGREGRRKSAAVAKIEIADGDLVVGTRDVQWPAADQSSAAQCGPLTTRYYQFNGSRFVEVPRLTLSAKPVELPRLPIQEKFTCVD